MSKARLVITAVTVEKRPVSEVAREYQVARSWVYALLARYQAEGEAAFEPGSRRPKASPNAISDQTAGLIVRLRKELSGQGLDAGPDTIRWHLEHHHGLTVSAATVSRYLSARGLVVPEPRKRPKSSYIRVRGRAAERVLAVRLHPLPSSRRDGHRDPDLARRPLPLRPVRHRVRPRHRPRRPEGIPGRRYRARSPASTLTDNGMVFTTRFSGGKGGRNALENELRGLGIKQKNGKPNHPQTQGKVERFQQALKNWLAAQTPQPADLAGLQALLDAFTRYYNTSRPHRSLPRQATPATAYMARPKATPGDRTGDTHDRVRTDRLDDTGVVTLRHAGKLHHIGTGRTHARTRVIMLVQDLHIRIIHAATGELLRELTLDPTRDYQPTGRTPGPPKGTPRPPRKPKNPEP
ncbi:MAG TPA: integrase core domain-containing protein [Streptosporangiaceae bacterium]|nr:integrase core domain-containing protein [Streptosporangiaceae bacterium]